MYYGTGSIEGRDIIIDNVGSVFVCGVTSDDDFETYKSPDTDPYIQEDLIYSISGALVSEAFIMKFSSLGSRIWATYYGGNSQDGGEALTFAHGNIYMTGYTYSSDFNKDSWNGTNFYYDGSYNSLSKGDAFLVGFNESNLKVRISTYFGGNSSSNNTDDGYGMATDGNDNLYLVGRSNSPLNFPVEELDINLTSDYYQDVLNDVSSQGSTQQSYDGFIARFTPPILVNTNRLTQGESFKIYPNPSDGLFNLELGKSIDDGWISIYSIDGQLIKTQVIVDEMMRLDLSDFSKGVYVLKVISSQNTKTQLIQIF